jgi:hypothetical protein
MNELLRQLKICRSLAHTQRSSTWMQKHWDISRATLNRDLSELRHLGAQIVAQRDQEGFLYKLENWPDICRTVETWIALEEKRDLLELGRTIL